MSYSLEVAVLPYLIVFTKVYSVSVFHVLDLLSGEKLTVFNGMSELYVGGEFSRQRNIERSYSGLISGFNFNGINVLDLAKLNHPTITIHGDARLTDLTRCVE